METYKEITISIKLSRVFECINLSLYVFLLTRSSLHISCTLAFTNIRTTNAFIRNVIINLDYRRNNESTRILSCDPMYAAKIRCNYLQQFTYNTYDKRARMLKLSKLKLIDQYLNELKWFFIIWNKVFSLHSFS